MNRSSIRCALMNVIVVTSVTQLTGCRGSGPIRTLTPASAVAPAATPTTTPTAVAPGSTTLAGDQLASLIPGDAAAANSGPLGVPSSTTTTATPAAPATTIAQVPPSPPVTIQPAPVPVSPAAGVTRVNVRVVVRQVRAPVLRRPNVFARWWRNNFLRRWFRRWG